jgi:hypothetical protein
VGEPFRTIEDALKCTLGARGYNRLRDDLMKVVKRGQGNRKG